MKIRKHFPQYCCNVVISILMLLLCISCSKKGEGTGPEPDEGYPDHVVATVPVGRGPMDVAVTPDNAYVYVSNEMGSSISVIRASDHTVVEAIPLGSLPAALCMDPNGDYLYVQDNISNTYLYIVRISDNTVVDTISGAMSINGFDITPNGEYLYLPVYTIDSVKVYRTSDYFITKVGVGDGPYDAAITPDGAFVYVCNVQDDAVSVIRVSDNSVVNTIPVGLFPVAITANPNGDYIYVANYQDISISVISTSDNTVVANIPADNVRDLCVIPNGKYLYAVVGGGVVDVFETENNELATTVAVGSGSIRVTASPNGEYVYVTNFADSTVSVIGK
jgi:YVTN family beta-propeller protein